MADEMQVFATEDDAREYGRSKGVEPILIPWDEPFVDFVPTAQADSYPRTGSVGRIASARSVEKEVAFLGRRDEIEYTAVPVRKYTVEVAGSRFSVAVKA
jgi:hypothetical protein